MEKIKLRQQYEDTDFSDIEVFSFGQGNIRFSGDQYFMFDYHLESLSGLVSKNQLNVNFKGAPAVITKGVVNFSNISQLKDDTGALSYYADCYKDPNQEENAANSLLSIFSLLNVMFENKKNDDETLFDLIDGANSYIPSTSKLKVKKEFLEEYFLSEEHFHNLSFPVFSHSKALARLIFSIKKRNLKHGDKNSFLHDQIPLVLTTFKALKVFAEYGFDDKKLESISDNDYISSCSRAFHANNKMGETNQVLREMSKLTRGSMSSTKHYSFQYVMLDVCFVEFFYYRESYENKEFTDILGKNVIFISEWENNQSQFCPEEFNFLKIALLLSIIDFESKTELAKEQKEHMIADVVSNVDTVSIDDIVSVACKYVNNGGRINIQLLSSILVGQ